MPPRFLHCIVGLVFLAVPFGAKSNPAHSEELKPATATGSQAKPAKPKAKAPAHGAASATAKGGAVQGQVAAKPEAAKPAQSNVTETKFQDWSMQCVTGAAASPPCQIMYRLMSNDKKQVVLVLSVALFPKDSTRLQMALPLGFAIPPGVKIAIGNDYSMDAQVSRCTIQGCIIEGEGPAKMIEAMMHEKGGVVSVHNMQGSVIQLPISLDGFVTAYNSLKEKTGTASN